MSTAANLVPSALETACARRARFWAAANNFQQLQPDVPSHVFVAERDRALDERTGTALIELDLSERLGLDYPATVPNLLARYVRIESADELGFELLSSGEVYYAIEGSGAVEKNGRIDRLERRRRVRASRPGPHPVPGQRRRRTPVDGDGRAGDVVLRGGARRRRRGSGALPGRGHRARDGADPLPGRRRHAVRESGAVHARRAGDDPPRHADRRVRVQLPSTRRRPAPAPAQRGRSDPVHPGRGRPFDGGRTQGRLVRPRGHGHPRRPPCIRITTAGRR